MLNYWLIQLGLKEWYNNRDVNNTLYLTEKQIDGILDYLMDLYGDDELLNMVDIQRFIDETVINGLGFDEQGQPILEQDDDEQGE